MYHVIVTARSFDSQTAAGAEILAANGCRVERLQLQGEALRQRLEQEIATADAVIAGLEPYDEALLRLAQRLKVISRYGAGVDNIDSAAAARYNVTVTATPGANSNAVADLAVGLMLAGARQIPWMDRSIRAGRQQRPTGTELWEKTVGIIGTGRIGQGVAKRCSGFQMKVLCVDKLRDERFVQETGAQYVTVEELLEQSDFVSLHVPLTEETRHLIGQAQLKSMRPGAVLVNTSRGGIVDEDALYQALKQGEIGAAALDATEQEPPYASPLLELDNCILTPHAGAATGEASVAMSTAAARNAVALLRGDPCTNIVPLGR